MARFYLIIDGGGNLLVTKDPSRALQAISLEEFASGHILDTDNITPCDITNLGEDFYVLENEINVEVLIHDIDAMGKQIIDRNPS